MLEFKELSENRESNWTKMLMIHYWYGEEKQMESNSLCLKSHFKSFWVCVRFFFSYLLPSPPPFFSPTKQVETPAQDLAIHLSRFSAIVQHSAVQVEACHLVSYLMQLASFIAVCHQHLRVSVVWGRVSWV